MYLCCSLKSLKERQQRKKKVNGGQEGILENFAASMKIVSKGIRMVKDL